MKRKLIALSILFFLLGTAGSIYVFPIQEALFVTKTTVDTTFQEITKGLGGSLKSSPLRGRQNTRNARSIRASVRSGSFAIHDIVTLLAQFLGIVACSYVAVHIITGATFSYNQALAQNTPQKAKKLKYFRDDIL